MTLQRAIPRSYAEKLTSIVSADRGGRLVSKLCRPEDWQKCTEVFAPLESVAVISGFYILAAGVPETDGPGGAVMIARAYLKSGRRSEIWTDELCLPVIRAAAEAVGYPGELVRLAPDSLDENAPAGLIFTERPGHAADGKYYNFRKKDISAWTPPLDMLAFEARKRSIPTLGIGDGGNEVGMGVYYEALRELLPDYADCLSVVCTDCALAADVSNWGAYALTAALSYAWGNWCGPEAEEELDMLNAEISVGVVDGISVRPEPAVDGFELSVQQKIILSLKKLWNSYI
ncbi:MAG: DUF4392 domain-containing protein [Synergistes sp.]|nr:DUF4392 domain-containing protein [Synergistes sp.]